MAGSLADWSPRGEYSNGSAPGLGAAVTIAILSADHDSAGGNRGITLRAGCDCWSVRPRRVRKLVKGRADLMIAVGHDVHAHPDDDHDDDHGRDLYPHELRDAEQREQPE